MRVPRPAPPAPRRTKWWEWVVFGTAIIALVLSVIGGTIGVVAAYTASIRYLQPVTMDVEKVGDQWIAELVRLTPRGEVWAEWSMEAVVEGEVVPPCHASGYTPFEQVNADETTGRMANTVVFAMAETMRPCLEAKRPVTIRTTYHVIKYGIKHRATPLTVTLN